MSDLKREMTFEEESCLYETETGWIIHDDLCEYSDEKMRFIFNVLRRGIRIIQKARDEIKFASIDRVKHGKWNGNTCSLCGRYAHRYDEDGETKDFIYCPYCGAKNEEMPKEGAEQ